VNEQLVRNPRIDRWLKPLAIAAAIGMFIVLLMGATVTNTGSSEGCGRSWPMCGGDMWSREMLIEASHRLVTGVEGFLVLGVGIGLWRTRGHRREARLLIAGMWGAILVQSGMGAWAVRSPQNSWVMALHFGFSVIAFASCVLTVEMIYRDERGSARYLHWSVPAGFKFLMWFTLIASYGIAYLGAYVRHSDAVIACATWPDCNGEAIPELSGPVGIHFAHRIAALGGMLLVFSLLAWSHRFRAERPDIYRICQAASLVILAQAFAGAIVVWTALSYFSTLLHAGLMAMLFVLLCVGCRLVLPVREPARSEALPGYSATAAPARS